MFSLESSHILCSPAGYVLDGEKGGSEPLWAHNIVREAGKRSRTVTAVTGYVASARLGPNVKVVTVGGKPGENFLAASVAARFTLQCGFAASQQFVAHRPALVHHILPFGLGQTFNPITPLLGRTPLVIGPVQGESYRRHFEQISLGGVDTKQGASTRQPLSNRLALAAGPLLAALNRRFVERADAVVAVSKEAAAFLADQIDTEKLHVIPPGVDTETFTCRPTHQGSEITLITAGYLLKRKRVDIILRALRVMVERGAEVRLLIVGDGPERDVLRALAGELGLQQHIDWLGFIENRFLASVYHRADLALSASEHEGLPTAYLEALSCGLPLICADNAGSRAVIVDERRGEIVEQGNHEALAAAVLRYASSRARLEEMARHVRDVATTEYDWSIIGDRYALAYQSAADHAARRG